MCHWVRGDLNLHVLNVSDCLERKILCPSNPSVSEKSPLLWGAIKQTHPTKPTICFSRNSWSLTDTTLQDVLISHHDKWTDVFLTFQDVNFKGWNPIVNPENTNSELIAQKHSFHLTKALITQLYMWNSTHPSDLWDLYNYKLLSVKRRCILDGCHSVLRAAMAQIYL